LLLLGFSDRVSVDFENRKNKVSEGKYFFRWHIKKFTENLIFIFFLFWIIFINFNNYLIIYKLDAIYLSRRLPRSILPIHYDLTVEPKHDLNQFLGTITIQLNVTESTNIIKIHSYLLTRNEL
jgi:hypothetical protein